MPYSWKPMLPSWKLPVFGRHNTTRSSPSASLFADIQAVEKVCVKAARLKSGFIERQDLIERLRQLKPAGNFELSRIETSFHVLDKVATLPIIPSTY